MDHYSESSNSLEEPCDSLEALGFCEVDVPAPPTPSPEQGERHLLMALLQDAAQTYKDHTLSQTRRGQRLFREAEAWFSASEPEAPVSFAYVCDALDINPARFRAKLASWRAQALASAPTSADVVHVNSIGRNGTPLKARENSTARPGGRRDVTFGRFPKGLPHRAANSWHGGNDGGAADIERTSKGGTQSQNLGGVARRIVAGLRKGETKEMKPIKTLETVRRAGVSLPKKGEQGAMEREPVPGKEEQASQQFADDWFVLLGYVGMCSEGIHGYRLSKMLCRGPLRLHSLPLGRLYRVLRRLESTDLLTSEVEADGGRLRYRFKITPEGKSCFRQWLISTPNGPAESGSHVLERLRFASLLSRDELSCLLEGAESACRASLEELGRCRASDAGLGAEVPHLYASAQKARLENELRWLEEVRALAARQATGGNWQNEHVPATAVA